MMVLVLGLAMSLGICNAQISDWYVCSSECYIHSSMGNTFKAMGSIKKDEAVNGLKLANGINTDIMKSLTVIHIDSSYNNNVLQVYYEVTNKAGLFGYVLKEKLMSKEEFIIAKNNEVIAIKANQHKENIKKSITMLSGYTNAESKKILKDAGYNDADIKEIILNR